MSKSKISEVSTPVLAALQGKEGILMAIPGSLPIIIFEDGQELTLDIDLAFYAGLQDNSMIWRGFTFQSSAILSGDVRMTGDENEFVIGFVCTPFTKGEDEGSDVIILRHSINEVTTVTEEE